MRKFSIFLLLLVVSFTTVFADQHAISIDGAFDDWSSVEVAYEDSVGDSTSTDFVRIWLADDDEFLFIRIELLGTFDASENNSVRLLLDTDNDSGTGLAVAGIDAELEWRLGERFGLLRVAGDIVPLSQNDISFRGGPTVTANTFEFAIGRDSVPGGLLSLIHI